MFRYHVLSLPSFLTQVLHKLSNWLSKVILQQLCFSRAYSKHKDHLNTPICHGLELTIGHQHESSTIRSISSLNDFIMFAFCSCFTIVSTYCFILPYKDRIMVVQLILLLLWLCVFYLSTTQLYKQQLPDCANSNFKIPFCSQSMRNWMKTTGRWATTGLKIHRL